jgi:putative methionine-R-sulfoxide reductase with GAF domain
VLDVDSDAPAAFDETDRQFLENVCGLFRDAKVKWND